MFSCMPFLSPLLLANATTTRTALHSVSLFSLGRVFGYTTVAFAASFAGLGIKAALKEPGFAQGLLAAATVGVGLWMLYRTFRPRQCCSGASSRFERFGRTGYFAMGTFITLTPCAPLASLITLAAGSGTAAEALAYGLCFGIGAAGASWLLFGLFLSPVAKEATQRLSHYRPLIERLAAALLIALGISLFNGASHI